MRLITVRFLRFFIKYHILFHLTYGHSNHAKHHNFIFIGVLQTPCHGKPKYE